LSDRAAAGGGSFAVAAERRRIVGPASLSGRAIQRYPGSAARRTLGRSELPFHRTILEVIQNFVRRGEIRAPPISALASARGDRARCRSRIRR
jgi:hypothetical protein